MSQKWYESHLETIAQTVGGLIISFIILQAFGMSVHESIKLQVVFLIASYARSYLIRRGFEKWNQRKLVKV